MFSETLANLPVEANGTEATNVTTTNNKYGELCLTSSEDEEIVEKYKNYDMRALKGLVKKRRNYRKSNKHFTFPKTMFALFTDADFINNSGVKKVMIDNDDEYLKYSRSSAWTKITNPTNDPFDVFISTNRTYNIIINNSEILLINGREIIAQQVLNTLKMAGKKNYQIVNTENDDQTVPTKVFRRYLIGTARSKNFKSKLHCLVRVIVPVGGEKFAHYDVDQVRSGLIVCCRNRDMEVLWSSM